MIHLYNTTCGYNYVHSTCRNSRPHYGLNWYAWRTNSGVHRTARIPVLTGHANRHGIRECIMSINRRAKKTRGNRQTLTKTPLKWALAFMYLVRKCVYLQWNLVRPSKNTQQQDMYLSQIKPHWSFGNKLALTLYGMTLYQGSTVYEY